MLRFIFVLHDHQPVGNFDHVFEQAYQDAYLPYLNVFERYDNLKMALHTSGSLMEWLDQHHPDYLDRVAPLVAAGRIEVVGGAFYESILAMIPRRDRVGQIKAFSRWLHERLGAPVRGMWVPERVWEQNMTTDLVAAGIQYTMLDDYHFKNAGLAETQLHGYYITEDDGNLLAVFPDSEPLRYMIPFRPPQDTIDYLAQLNARVPNAVAVFGDDGEKLGSWPETHHTVYEEGWLVQFFDLLTANQSWLKTVTPIEVIESTPPVDRIYLPEGSYREMTEWVLPSAQLADYAAIRREMIDSHDPRWPRLEPFVRGGFWRNFRVKYPESNEMYTRMMMVSRRLQSAVEGGARGPLIDQARTALYRSQCNCAYWHGAFGGVYLPHLRNAIFREAITADNLLDRALSKPESWVDLTADDFNLDGRQEVCLANDKLLAIAAPHRGGMLYELDVKQIAHNLLATMDRRPEAYHAKVLGGDGRNDVAGVSDRVIFKQQDLAERLRYDGHPRKSLLDHFYASDVTLDSIARCEASELGDFLHRAYEARLRRNPARMQLQLSAQGNVANHPVRVTKSLTLEAGSSTLEIGYLLEGLPTDRALHFAVELNFAGMPAGADDRYFYARDRRPIGQLGTRLDIADARELGLVDQWLGIDVNLTFSRPTGLWTFPIETVSQSEGGFESVHQSVAVLPHWHVQADTEGRWQVALNLAIGTKSAPTRQEQPAVALTT